MSLISLLSVVAAVLALSAAVPQILRMHRARSAAGQSPTGWAMGAACHGCMVYVNLVGYGAPLLAAGNAASLTLCAAAVASIGWLGRRHPATSRVDLTDLPTQEFQLLVREVRSAQRRRSVPAPQC
jgi:hypothetical protein